MTVTVKTRIFYNKTKGSPDFLGTALLLLFD